MAEFTCVLVIKNTAGEEIKLQLTPEVNQLIFQHIASDEKLVNLLKSQSHTRTEARAVIATHTSQWLARIIKWDINSTQILEEAREYGILKTEL